MSEFTRREFGRFVLAAAVTGAAGATLGGCAADVAGTSATLVPSRLPLPKPFSVPLPKASVLRPDRAGRILITQRVADLQILPGVRTPVWGYDGTFPGPTIETRSGSPVTITHTNALPVPTVTHLHGGHTPADSDGWPTDLLLPQRMSDGNGGTHAGHTGMTGMADPEARLRTSTREYRYPMDQPAATLWYHDHRMDFTGPAVWRGLAGMHLVRDDHEDSLSLPRDERELPLLIADRSFDADGSFRYPSVDPTLQRPGVADEWMSGVLGDVMLVNGAPWPVAEVDAARYRLRILNAGNARRLSLTLDADGTRLPFVQIGSDGGLLAAPRERGEITLAPGERIDAVVDFAALPPGRQVTMRNGIGGGGTALVMRFAVARRGRDDSRVPARLAERPPARDIPAGAPRRNFLFARGSDGRTAMWTINGEPFRPQRAVATIQRDRTEIWRLTSNVHHPVHVHLDPFLVLGREDDGLKDTVDMLPGETLEIAVRFSDYVGRYVLHCHNLEHEDMAMMARFDVR
ncbi:multicopper oxidase family protein [Nakamurella aerolata]|uniref:Multicopper oxidase CueO n=1 Tax=Nakamurella aerolata TaxID=1656892 RepID=A0A849A7B3_9ACTN|nr:multicopper oxidase family protein [Nakamurella aerolata]NNG34931.1 multicopper oxidase family protein [Nakamurella aerolata]